MFNNIHSQTSTITDYEKKILKKGKNALYLVLRQKTFPDQIIDELKIEVEKRFKNFLMNIAPKLNNIKLENKENGLKYILIKGLINILNQMFNERMITLSDKDRNIVKEIFDEKGDEQFEDKKVDSPAMEYGNHNFNINPNLNPYKNNKSNNYHNSQFSGMRRTPSYDKNRNPNGLNYNSYAFRK